MSREDGIGKPKVSSDVGQGKEKMAADNRTAILIPCCKTKMPGGERYQQGAFRFREGLSEKVRNEVLEGRRAILRGLLKSRTESGVREGPDFGGQDFGGLYRPSWQRYSGFLYEELPNREILAREKHEGPRLLILSALYGPLDPKELIQDYELQMGQTLMTCEGKIRPLNVWKRILPEFFHDWMVNEGLNRILLVLCAHYLDALKPSVQQGLREGWLKEVMQCKVLNGGTGKTPKTHGRVLSDLLLEGYSERPGVQWISFGG